MFRGLPLLFLVGWMYGQNLETTYGIELNGLLAGDAGNPFWMSHNNQFQIGEYTSFASNVSASMQYALTENAFLNVGAWLYYRDAVRTNNLQRRDLFLNFSHKWLSATLGAKRNEDPSDGLSVSAKNFLYSGNARPLPGILVEAYEPLKIWEGGTLDWGIGHYVLNDDRYVTDTYVHYKRLGLHWQWNDRNGLTASLQHYVQWGGNSPEVGKIKTDLGDFVDIFFASKPEGNAIANEALNALGNHLGTYYVEYQTTQDWGGLSLYHDHPFEDGSGTALKNFPHGIWGIHYKPTRLKWVSAILYEYVDTKSEPEGYFDNYFSNGIYRSGWTYEGNIIGVPFILNDPNLVLGPDKRAIISNKVAAHHVGIKGNWEKWDWMLKTSWVAQSLELPNTVPVEQNAWYTYAQIGYTTSKWGQFRLTMGLDSVDIGDNRWGMELSYLYRWL